ncbi:DNA polymerase zeta [Geranomyces variabilis]|uniref:DNA polymerase zeta catalytic subunit n=1 Tax=Geranomyces variabilis TaxID=109894 RepID=A0AAD5TK24_9FUNG|nr:DNA polymerase zeta [Geranomyces variabilis]
MQIPQPQPQPQPLQPQAQHREQQQPRDDPFVSVRIVSMDHYMTYPNPLLDRTATQFSAPGTRGFKVPVVRIFGVTALGQKACVHLHNAYRYFYIPYEGPSDPAQARIYIHKLGTSLNHATALAYGKDRDDAGKNLYIASIGLVKGIPFYGVHPVYRPFLKVSILDPNKAKKIVTILQSGTVLGTCFQPYEVHLSYLHQLFIDYDLYGMDFIHFYQARFRLPILHVPRTEPAADPTSPIPASPSSPLARFFSEDTLPDRYKWSPRSRVRRQSYCEIELDAWVGDVMNRARVKERPMVALPGGSSGLDGIKLIPSLQSIWKDEQERRIRSGITEPLSDTGTQLSARDEYSPWSNEARLRAELDASIIRNISRDHRPSTFDDRALEYLPTAFQSVPCWRPNDELRKGDGTAQVVPADDAVDADHAADIQRESSLSSPLSSQDYDMAFADLPVVIDIERMTQALREEQEEEDRISQAVAASQDSESALLNLVEALEREEGGGAGVLPAAAATAREQLSQTRRQLSQVASLPAEEREAEDPVLNDGLSDASGDYDDLSMPDGFLEDLQLLYAQDDVLDPGSPVSLPRSPATPRTAGRVGPGPSPLRKSFTPSHTPADTPSRVRTALRGPTGMSPGLNSPTPRRGQSGTQAFDDPDAQSRTLPARGQEVLRMMAKAARDHNTMPHSDTLLDDGDMDVDQDRAGIDGSEAFARDEPPSPPPRLLPISARRFRLPQVDGAGDSTSPPKRRASATERRAALPPRAPQYEIEEDEDDEPNLDSSPPLIAGSRKRRRRIPTFSSSPLLGTAESDESEILYYRHNGADRPPEFVKPSNSFDCVAISPLKSDERELFSGSRRDMARVPPPRQVQSAAGSTRSTPELIGKAGGKGASSSAPLLQHRPLPRDAKPDCKTMEVDDTAREQMPSVSETDQDPTHGTQTDLVSPQPRKRPRMENAAAAATETALSPLLLEPRSDTLLPPPLSLPQASRHSPASSIASVDMFIPSEGAPPLLLDGDRPGVFSRVEDVEDDVHVESADESDDVVTPTKPANSLSRVVKAEQDILAELAHDVTPTKPARTSPASNTNPVLIDKALLEEPIMLNQPTSTLSSDWDEYATEDVSLISLLDGAGANEGAADERDVLLDPSLMIAASSTVAEQGRAASPATSDSAASQVSLVDSPSKHSSGVALINPARHGEVGMSTPSRAPIELGTRFASQVLVGMRTPGSSHSNFGPDGTNSPASSPTPMPRSAGPALLPDPPVERHEQAQTTFPAPLTEAEEVDTPASSPSHIDFPDLEAHTPYNIALPRLNIVAVNESADWTFSARPPGNVETLADATVPIGQFAASLLSGLGIPSEQQVPSEPIPEDATGDAELGTAVVPGIVESSGGSGPPQADLVHVSLSSSANSSEERAKVAAAPAGPVPAPSASSRLIRPARAPPSTEELLATLKDYRIARFIYREPFYSDAKDVPARAKTYGTREFKLQADDPAFLPEFKPALPEIESQAQPRQGFKGLAHWRHVKFDEGLRTSIKVWQPGISPPTRQETEKWLKEQKPVAVPRGMPKAQRAQNTNDVNAARKPEVVSQLEAPTPKNAYGFKYDQISAKAVTQERQFVSILSMELHAASQGDLLPNPHSDPIRCLFYCLKQDDYLRFPSNGHRQDYFVGIVMVGDEHPLSKTGVTSCVIDVVADEKSLVELFTKMVRGFDPDFLAGFEIHNSSWGYLVERAHYAHSIDILSELARVRPDVVNTKFGAEEDAWGSRKQSHLSTTGRNFLNVWRLLRNEINLTSYTLESVAYHVLHIRVPKFSSRSLAEWYDGPHTETRMLFRWRTVAYYLARTQHVMSLIEDTETVSRTSEFARVFGIDFMSVLTRGSQYKVESIMARIAKPENYVLLAPSGKQVFHQRACECLPLVMEPDSRFYTSPLLVLDFQSLYPSIMIAYNYCYSTCLGRVQNVGAPGKLGVLDDYEVSAEFVERYKDLINVSPNGVAFLKEEVRAGTLRRMLTEILDTRVMVKQSMKLYKADKALLRILEARQLGLKFIANVTYGYTGASFSGRMPCAEIADAIVQTGRATLEKGINIIHGNPKWGARVVYGDTDSLFVHLPGATKDDAFRIGREIVNAITRTNPEPVKLKFEKVYHPCVLLAKKRYVGFKYENPEDVEPVFDAKGIETVRRDGCPAVAKEMEQCIKMLFRSQDMSEVKRHCHRQWSKILTGRASVQDFIKATEVKLGSYTVPPPGALVAMRKMASDPRAEPQIGERVPYVVVHGGPNYKLKDSVVPPEELLFSRNLRLHGQYYVERMIIPAISRVFNLVGVDLMSWYRDMPKIIAATRFTASQLMQEQPDTRGPIATLLAGRTIDQYYVARHCVVCHALVAKPGRGGGAGDRGGGGGGGNGGGDTTLCASCRADTPTTAATLAMRSSAAQRAHAQIQNVCRSCTGHATALDADSACISLDCPVFFARLKANDAARLAERWEKSCAQLEW